MGFMCEGTVLNILKMKSVYSALFLDVLKSGKFQLESRMRQTVDALWICKLRRWRVHNCVPVVGRVLHIISVRSLRVCSFNSNGQYQSLRTWDGQQVPASRFSFLIHLLTPKRKPGGNQNSFNHEEIL